VLAVDMAKAFDTLDHRFIDEVYKFFGLGPVISRWLQLCGNGRQACIILDNETYSRNFDLGSVRAQGDNVSPMTFNFCEQILIFKLELDPLIQRIPRNNIGIVNAIQPFSHESNRETDTNKSLADDNTALS
jgi:Reverse transcriptase (RNA-dependent DNA polymerase)